MTENPGLTEQEVRTITEREREKYLKLNNLKIEECIDIDLENIAFNAQFAMAQLE